MTNEFWISHMNQSELLSNVFRRFDATEARSSFFAYLVHPSDVDADGAGCDIERFVNRESGTRARPLRDSLFLFSFAGTSSHHPSESAIVTCHLPPPPLPRLPPFPFTILSPAMESQQPAEPSTGNKPKPNGPPANVKPPPQKTSQPPIPARFANAPLFHRSRLDKERFLKRASTSASPSTPSPPHMNGSRPSPGATPRPRRPPQPKIKKEEEEVEFSGEFQEFRLLSSSLNGWKYNVMKFESHRLEDIDTWERPVKLNRKELKREQESRDGPGVGLNLAITPMLGADGKPVIGGDGKIVMLDADGRPMNGERASGAAAAKPKERGPGRKKFQKKTRQVFLVPEATRQLRREERYPWVMESGDGEHIWTGMLDDIHKAETHAMFLPTVNNVFKFVAPHRWYRFQKRHNHKIPSLEEAERMVSAIQR